MRPEKVGVQCVSGIFDLLHENTRAEVHGETSKGAGCNTDKVPRKFGLTWNIERAN